MKRNVVLFLYVFFFLLALFVIYVIGSIIHGTLTDYEPEEITPLEQIGEATKKVITDSIVTFANWNIGYGGLGENANFFYDSDGFFTSRGKMVRSSKEDVESYIKGISNLIQKTDADFFLLQEVDQNSKRSYYTNEFEAIAALKPDYQATFAANFKVKRVPIPVLEFWNVIGKTHSGLGSYSAYQATEATRYQFPGDFGWPTRIFQLDRCFALHRYPTASGKELIVINTHNSAYDNGTLKPIQMAYMKVILLEEYAKGNYVVVGGDWNQCPPNFKFDTFAKSDDEGRDYPQMNIPHDYLPHDWLWAYDPSVPTNRKLTDSYESGKTFTTLIDFYLVSPNVKILEVKGIDTDFKYSDHQPVLMKVELMEPVRQTVETSE